MLDNNDNIDRRFNELAALLIKSKRIEKGYSLEDVVSKMSNKITKQALHKYENNEARMKTRIFNELCKILALDADEVLEKVNLKLLDNNQFKETSEFVNIYKDLESGITIQLIPTEKPWDEYTKEEQEKYISAAMDALFEYKRNMKYNDKT